jgi:hypothetical protein
MAYKYTGWVTHNQCRKRNLTFKAGLTWLDVTKGKGWLLLFKSASVFLLNQHQLSPKYVLETQNFQAVFVDSELHACILHCVCFVSWASFFINWFTLFRFNENQKAKQEIIIFTLTKRYSEYKPTTTSIQIWSITLSLNSQTKIQAARRRECFLFLFGKVSSLSKLLSLSQNVEHIYLLFRQISALLPVCLKDDTTCWNILE